MTGWVDEATAVGTIGAALASAWAALKAGAAARAAAEVAEIERNRRDEERERGLVADVRARLEPAGEPGVHWLIVENRGPAVAERVAAEQTASLGGLAQLAAMPGLFPLDLLANDRIQAPVHVVAVAEVPHTTLGVRVVWHDGTGDRGHDFTLTLR